MKKNLIFAMALTLATASCGTENVVKTTVVEEPTTTIETTTATEPPTTETIVVTEEQAATENDDEPIIITIEETEITLSESDTILLAQLINVESSDSWEGKLAVASCVVNRMNYFGTNMYDTIYMQNQFAVNHLDHYTDTDYEAAKYVLTNGSWNTDLFYFHSNYEGTNAFSDVGGNYIGNF